MVLKLRLMASRGYPPGLVLQQKLGFDSIAKGCQPLLPSPVVKPEIIRYGSLIVRPNACEASRKYQSEWSSSNKFVNVALAAQRPMLTGVRATCPNALLFNFSLMDLQLLGIDEPQQNLSLLMPLLDYFGDSSLNSKVIVHLDDGLVTFMGAGAEMKYLLSAVAESYLLKNSHKGEKKSMLIPHFCRLNINEAESRSQPSTFKIQSKLTAPLRSPQKVKVKPSPKKNKKASRERDLHKENCLHACESLLSLIVDKRQRRKTGILSLKKSGPELPQLLTQFSAGIAGTGLAVLLSVICKVACGRVPFFSSKLLNTGFGLGLLWLSCAVNKLRSTIVGICKNAGKLGLTDEEMSGQLDKNIREIYFRTAALLAVVVLRLA